VFVQAAGSEQTITFPPVVYVPCERPPAPDGELTVDLRRTRDGQVVLLVYSALDRLVCSCGPRQPWVVMPTASLEHVNQRAPFDMVLLDMDIPEEHRRWETRQT